MKRLLEAGLALALVAGSAGCVDLNEKLVSQLGATYASTPQGITDLTNGVYAAARGLNGGDNWYRMQQMGVDTWTTADQVYSGGAQPWAYMDTYDGQFTSLDNGVRDQWNVAYQIIADANVVLDNAAKAPVGGVLTQGIKDSRMGEASFLRAWAYFNLIQQYGCGTGPTCGVTVNLHTGALSTEAKRESEDSVYKVIIADLTTAAGLLPATQSDWGRITKGAANAELAKVYLTRAYRDWNAANKTADFQQALTLAQGVINSGTYVLLPAYADLWCAPQHRAGAPADPARQGFCEMSGFNERNTEVIWSLQFTWDPTQSSGGYNYNHVVYLSQYDGGAGGWAAGITRDLDNGRPFRRVRETPAAYNFYNQLRYPNGQGGFGVDVVDTRYDGGHQTVWFANGNVAGGNRAGVCPKCTSGADIHGSWLNGVAQSGAAAGSDTALVYLGFFVDTTYLKTKAYRIGTPCPTFQTAPGADCGKDNDAKGYWGWGHFPTNKKFQDNGRPGGYNDMNGGKDHIRLRLGDMYLVAAEAALGLGQKDVAAAAIQVLHNRAACNPSVAHMPTLCTTDHTNDAQMQVTAGMITLDYIMDEREREMGGEFTRWEDLRRPGKDFFLNRIRTYNPSAAPNVKDMHYSRPIPAQQIQGVTGDPYPQNPGW